MPPSRLRIRRPPNRRDRLDAASRLTVLHLRYWSQHSTLPKAGTPDEGQHGSAGTSAGAGDGGGDDCSGDEGARGLAATRVHLDSYAHQTKRHAFAIVGGASQVAGAKCTHES